MSATIVVEVLGAGFCGADPATDERVIWVEAPGLQDVRDALAGVPHAGITTLDLAPGTLEIDYRLPADKDKLVRRLASFVVGDKRPVRVDQMAFRGPREAPERQVRAPVGAFHGFGVDYEEFEAGPAPYSVAIVELPDGSVILPRADMITFLDKEQA